MFIPINTQERAIFDVETQHSYFHQIHVIDWVLEPKLPLAIKGLRS